MPNPKGRPIIYNSPEEREAARKASMARTKAKSKLISVDADLQEKLNDVCDRLEPTLGFRPTLSQALRYLIRKAQP